MGTHRLRHLAILALPLLIGACASKPTDEQRLLYRNDMLQAKLLIASNDPANYPLASALLQRAHAADERGESRFYAALLKIRCGAPSNEVLPLLEDAADAGQPYATALLYKVWHDPFLVESSDVDKAEHYRAAYANLDVAKSGYPSFEQARSVVERLLAAPMHPAVAQAAH